MPKYVFPAYQDRPLLEQLVRSLPLERLTREHKHDAAGMYKRVYFVTLGAIQYVLKRCAVQLKDVDPSTYHGREEYHRTAACDIEREVAYLLHASHEFSDMLHPYVAWGEVDGVFYGVQERLNLEYTSWPEQHEDELRIIKFKEHIERVEDGLADFDLRPDWTGNWLSGHNVGRREDGSFAVYDYGYSNKNWWCVNDGHCIQLSTEPLAGAWQPLLWWDEIPAPKAVTWAGVCMGNGVRPGNLEDAAAATSQMDLEF